MNVIGLLRTLERVTRPPTRPTFSDTDDPLTDEMRDEGWEFTAIPEPGLTPDELVGVRGLLQERYGEACTCPSWGNPNWPHRHGCPADPHKSSASNHAGTGAEPAPSPTIVQSAPPPTVDGAGPASVRDIPPSPEAGRPTSELLTEAADFLSIHASRTESGDGARAYIRDTLLPEIDARAAIFKAIEE